MKASGWLAVSFGSTLALVVGMRLNAVGLHLAAIVLLSALLLCPLYTARVVATSVHPHVRVERRPVRYLRAVDTRKRVRVVVRKKQRRRGDWGHLALRGSEEKLPVEQV